MGFRLRGIAMQWWRAPATYVVSITTKFGCHALSGMPVVFVVAASMSSPSNSGMKTQWNYSNCDCSSEAIEINCFVCDAYELTDDVVYRR